MNAEDLAGAIREGEVAGDEVDQVEERPRKRSAKHKPTVPAAAEPEERHFAGEACGQPRCRGKLKAITTLDTPEGVNLYLACDACSHQPANNVQRVPRMTPRPRG